jgi:hypothetical protein
MIYCLTIDMTYGIIIVLRVRKGGKMESKLVPLLIAVWLGCVIYSNKRAIALLGLAYAAIKVA